VHYCVSTHPAKQRNTHRTKASLRAAPTLNISVVRDCKEKTRILTINVKLRTHKEDQTDNNPLIICSVFDDPNKFVFNISLIIE